MDFWGSHYNAACFYSLVLGVEKICHDSRTVPTSRFLFARPQIRAGSLPELKEHCISAVLEQLTLALVDLESAEADNVGNRQ